MRPAQGHRPPSGNAHVATRATVVHVPAQPVPELHGASLRLRRSLAVAVAWRWTAHRRQPHPCSCHALHYGLQTPIGVASTHRVAYVPWSILP